MMFIWKTVNNIKARKGIATIIDRRFICSDYLE